MGDPFVVDEVEPTVPIHNTAVNTVDNAWSNRDIVKQQA
jgi:hypothetical protein